jgi:hypothetical protein
MDGQENIEQEVERLKSEKAQLERKLDRKEARARRWRRSRHAVVGLLVFLGALAFVLGTVTAWAHWLVLNPEHLSNTVGPLPSNPKVAVVLSTRITDAAFEAAHVQERLQEQLPPKVAFIAGPITNAVHGFVQSQVQAIIQSPQFEAFWRTAVSFSARQAVGVLRGNTGTVSVRNGTVSLNLIPVVNNALKEVQARASELLGRNVTLPTITAGMVPAEARAKLEQALGVTLPENFAQIVIFRSSSLEAAQSAVRIFDRSVWALAILALIFIVLAIVLSDRKRRTALQLATAVALGFVIVRNLLRLGDDQVVKLGRTPEGRAAINVIVHQVARGLFLVTGWMLVAALIVLLVGAITGPYGWAVAFRGWVVQIFSALGSAGDRIKQPEAVAWIRAHEDLLRIGGAVVAILLLLILSVSWLALFLIGGLLALYEIVITRVGRTPAASD